MARRRLGVGETGDVRYEKIDTGKVRAFVRVRLRDGKLVQVQADDTSREKAKDRVLAAAMRRAREHADEQVGPATPLHVAATAWVRSQQAARHIGSTSADAYRGDIERMRGEDGIGDLPLADCTPPRVQGYLEELSRRTPSAAKRYKSLLRRTFAYADQRGADLDRPDPVGKVALTAPARPTPRAATLGDLEELRQRIVAWQDHADQPRRSGPRRWQHLADSVDVMLGTGIRIGELLALRWEDVDLGADTPTLTVSGTIVRRTGKHGGLERQPHAKTDAGHRTITLPRFVVAALLSVKLEADGGGEGYIFASRSGGPMCPHNFGRRWREVRGDEYAWITPHSFRRTTATMIDREADVDAAAAVLGHHGPETTTRHYIEKAAAIAPDMSDVLEKLAPRK